MKRGMLKWLVVDVLILSVALFMMPPPTSVRADATLAYTSVTYGGTLTLNTAETNTFSLPYATGAYETNQRAGTFVFSFDNFTIQIGQLNLGLGNQLDGSASFSGDWSVSTTGVGTNGVEFTFDPSSGSVSEVKDASILGAYENGSIFFNFWCVKVDAGITTTRSQIDYRTDPPSVWMDAYPLTSPISDLTYVLPAACNYNPSLGWDLTPIQTATPYQSQNIPFSGSLGDISYTGNLALTFEGGTLEQTRQLTISTTTGGTTEPSPDTYTEPEGVLVIVTAIPNASYTLNHWALDGTNIGNDNPTTVLMDTDHSIQAFFTQGSTTQYTLNIWNSTGGSTSPPTGNYTQDAGTALSVTATPNDGHAFNHWLLDDADAGSDNPFTVFFNSNHVLQPVFTQGYTLTVQTQISHSGDMAGSQVTLSLSQTDTLQLNVAAGQVSGTGSGQGTLSVSGASGVSPASAQFTNTYSVTGTVDEDGNASLDITQVTTNAPSEITVNITVQMGQTTMNLSCPIPVGILTDNNYFRSYGILLQNGYQETVPFPWDGRQIQGQTGITVGGTGPPNRTVGVNQGDWAEYSVSMGAYGGTIPPSFVEMDGGNLSVTGVSGSNAALRILAQYKDGTSDLMVFQVDVNTGEATSGPNFFLIATGLGTGEDENNFKINGTSIWQYNGQDRPTVYSNSTLGDYIWDQTTGLLIYAKLSQYSEGSITLDATMTLQLVDTNAFVTITPHTLTIQSSTGGSTIPTGTHTQNAGTTLNVTATPNNGYTFANWLLDGANAGNSNPITITFNFDHALQPVFTQGGQSSARTVGVNQGDWAQYSVSWQTGTPSFLSDITSVKVTVGEISGTTLTISLTMQFKNGTTTPSSPFTLDVNTGQGGTTTGLDTGVIASKLNQSDLVFTSPQSPLPNAQITDVTTWTQNGFNRTTVHFKSDALGEYYWDRDTGILLYAEVPVYSGTSTPTATATLTLTSTNRFNGGSVPGGMPTSLLPLIAGAVAVVIGLIVAAVALRRHRRKKRAPPAETVEPKATLATPPKAVEPGTPASKKFAFCPDCGEKLPDLNAKFCPFCGARLDLSGANAKTGTETPKEAAPEGKAGTTSEADKKLGPLKNAKTSKHGWKLKIVASLLIIAIAINTVYYFGVFNLNPALQPAQQIMDWIWSAPGLAQVHQAISQAVQGIKNLIPGGSNGGGFTTIMPTQDLTGTWGDIQGEGLVVTPLNGLHRFHYDARMDLVQHGSTFTGTMYISLWNAEALVPYSTGVDDGFWHFSPPGPVQTEEVTNGTISGVNIQFQVIGWTWKGTFTTGLMIGTVQGYSSGVSYSGTFTLRRG
jgi:hypothetical protein